MINGIVETALYVRDLEEAKRFYAETLKLPHLTSDERFAAFKVRDGQVLLLFQENESNTPTPAFGGTIPPHAATGSQHIGFAVSAGELPSWESELHRYGIEIEGRVHWPKGGVSIYFRDPSGNLLELLTPGVWEIY